MYRENRGQPEKDLLRALLRDCSLRYDKPDSNLLQGGQKWSNSGGIVAFRDPKILLRILEKLV